MKEVIAKENEKSVKVHTKSELLEMILDESQFEDTEENQARDPYREFTHKRKVLKFILENKIPTYTGTSENIDEIKATIDSLVDHDLSLFGYTFFVASNPTFNYSWGYLRSKMGKFKEFLTNTNVFISNMLKDVNDIQRNFNNKIEIDILFDGVFGFTFLNGMALSKCYVEWENFYKIAKVSNKEYCISIKVGKVNLFSFKKKYKDDMSLIIDIMSKTINNDTKL